MAASAEPRQRELDLGQAPRRGIPALFTELPTIRDELVTVTSSSQDETVGKCLPLLKGRHVTQHAPFNEFGLPRLYREIHIPYLYDALEDYPGGFVALDASRPWMVYWALTGLYLMGEDVTKLRRRYV
jgi:protein farnesyltransferase subunit beta